MLKITSRLIWPLGACGIVMNMGWGSCAVAWGAPVSDSAQYEVPERPSQPLAASDVSPNARMPLHQALPVQPGRVEAPAASSYPSRSGGEQGGDLPAPTLPESGAMVVPPPPVVQQAPAVSPVVPYGSPEATVDTSTITRTLTFRDLGVLGPMTLRGFSPLQGFDIPLPSDEVVTRAQVVLDGALSPSLLPEASSLTLTLNEQYIGTVQVDPKNSRFGPLVFDIDPIFFTRLSHLNFLFAGEYRRDCNDLHNGVLWARVSDLSKIIITTSKLPPVRRLSRLPNPFFEKYMRNTVRVPFVFPHYNGQTDLKAAGIVASWFGKLADFRGTSFPVTQAIPAQGNAIEVGENLPIDSNGNMPSGPMLFEIPNPNDQWGTVLVVTGRNKSEVETAARVLAFSSDTLGDVPSRLVNDVSLAPRHPYDAPAFVPTDRAVRLGELIAATDLQRQGGAPIGIQVPFQIPPDLFRWRQHGFPLDLHIRTPAAEAFEHEGARVDVLVNNAYIQSFPLFADSMWDKITKKVPQQHAGALALAASVPPWLLFGGRNQLDFSFNVLPIDRGACRRVNDAFIAEVDANSTLDFRNTYHYARLPDLSYFAGSAFPFSKMADYSQTVVVLPPQPDMETATAFLDLMGFLGASTKYPTVGIEVASSADLSGVLDTKDIIILSSLDQLGAAKQLLSRSAYEVDGASVHLGQKTFLDGLWYLFQDQDGAGQNNNAKPLLTTPIVKASLLIGGESPLAHHKSVVAILADQSAQLKEMVASLRDKQALPAVQGDLVIKNGAVLTNYRNAHSYSVGDLPLWLRVEMLLERHMVLLGLLGLLGVGMVTVGTAKWLRNRARSRLQRRLAKEDDPIEP